GMLFSGSAVRRGRRSARCVVPACLPKARRRQEGHLRIARRFNAGKHPARHTSPEGTAEGWGVGLDLSRPFGTRDLLAPNPALKRWAILACPFGTARQRSSHADKRPRCPAYDYWSMTRLRREREFTLLC